MAGVLAASGSHCFHHPDLPVGSWTVDLPKDAKLGNPSQDMVPL